jgi:DNA-binding NarL/FixJ family response regulator
MERAIAHADPAHRIVIVDDHAIMRDGLTAILEAETDLDVVGVAEDGRKALEVVGQQRPDLVLIDLSMPHTDGSRCIERIKRRYPDTGVVVLTFHQEEVHVHAALKAGAEGYVLKRDGRNELLTAIRNVAAGRGYLSPAICGSVVAGYLRGRKPVEATNTPSWDLLTTREREVAKLVAEGYKNREIAAFLSLSPKTVEKHRANMMRKLNLHSASEVTAYAISNGLLSQ